MTRAAIALIVALGCGGRSAPATAPPPPAPAPLEPAAAEALADSLVEVLAEMAQITASTDCQIMGTQLGALFDRAAPLVAEIRALDEDPESARRMKAAMDARAPRVGPLVEAMEPGLVRCRQDASVLDAMARMPTF